MNGQASDERRVTVTKKTGAAASNWSTSDTAPGAGDVVVVTAPVRPQRDITPLEDMAIGEDFARGNTQNGPVKCEFSTEAELHYQATAEHLLFAMVLGDSGGDPSTPDGGTLSREQYFELATNINGVVASIGEGSTPTRTGDQPSADVVPSAIAKGFTLTCQDAGVAMLKADWLGIDAFLNPAPADDPLPDDLTLGTTLAAIAAATCASEGRRVMMGDCKVYIDDADGTDDFADADDGPQYLVQSSRLEVTVQRNQSYPDYGSQLANAIDGSSRPMLPVNNEQLVVPTLSLMFKRVVNDALYGKCVAKMPQRIRIEFIGGIIEDDITYMIRIDLPRVILKTAPRDKAKGNISRTVTGGCYKAATAPTGFPSTNPIRITVRNLVGDNILA